MDPEHVVGELGAAVDAVQAPATEAPAPCEMITPFAGLSAPMVTSAVTVKEWFFTLTTLFSCNRPMPDRELEFPLMRVGRPAVSGMKRSCPGRRAGAR